MKSLDSYRLKGMACLAVSQVLRDPQARATASQLSEGYLSLADSAAERGDSAATNESAQTAGPQKRRQLMRRSRLRWRRGDC
jgi:hypothetical protein